MNSGVRSFIFNGQDIVMRKCILFLILWGLCLTNTIIAQTTQYSFNREYRIGIPSKLELQNSELNSIVEGKDHQVNVSSYSNKIVFQQKGLNANVKSAYSKYCRVIIEYFKENRNDPTYGRGDQIQTGRDLLYEVHSSVKEACLMNKTPLLKFLNIQSLTISGFPVLYYSYKRKGWLKDDGKHQPPVIVNVYTIFNKYEYVVLTFSYREAERESWKDIHSSIVKTFTFMQKY